MGGPGADDGCAGDDGAAGAEGGGRDGITRGLGAAEGGGGGARGGTRSAVGCGLCTNVPWFQGDTYRTWEVVAPPVDEYWLVKVVMEGVQRVHPEPSLVCEVVLLSSEVWLRG